MDTIAHRWANLPVVVDRIHTQLHLAPVRDIAPHKLCSTCECGAFEDPEAADYIVHNSWDGREAYETGKRRKH